MDNSSATHCRGGHASALTDCDCMTRFRKRCKIAKERRLRAHISLAIAAWRAACNPDFDHNLKREGVTREGY